MTAFALALTASLAYGASDFLGGLRSRSLPLLGVLLISQGTGLVLLVATVLVRGEGPPGATVLAVAALAGASEAVAVAALYRGLAVGTMSIVAPLSALAPVLPVVVGAALGQAASTPVQGLGITAAILGVVLISRSRRRTRTETSVAPSVVLGLVAAAGFGGFYVAIDAASHAGVVWVLVTARLTAVTIFVTAAVIGRPRLAFRTADLPLLALTGALIVGADSLYALASTRGDLGVVAVLASLYPLVTIALARAYLHERLAPVQRLGIGVCLAGIVTISLS